MMPLRAILQQCLRRVPSKPVFLFDPQSSCLIAFPSFHPIAATLRRLELLLCACACCTLALGSVDPGVGLGRGTLGVSRLCGKKLTGITLIHPSHFPLFPPFLFLPKWRNGKKTAVHLARHSRQTQFNMHSSFKYICRHGVCVCVHVRWPNGGICHQVGCSQHSATMA